MLLDGRPLFDSQFRFWLFREGVACKRVVFKGVASKEQHASVSAADVLLTVSYK